MKVCSELLSYVSISVNSFQVPCKLAKQQLMVQVWYYFVVIA